jgi:hypothetical protein
VCIAIFVVNEALSWLMRSTFRISDLLLLLLLLRDGYGEESRRRSSSNRSGYEWAAARFC